MKNPKMNVLINKSVAEWLSSPAKREEVNIYHSKEEALKTIQQFPEDSYFIVLPAAAGVLGEVNR